MAHDPELVNQAIQLLSMKDKIVMTLTWMIAHFDFEREIEEWGSESDELIEAKELRNQIKNIGD